MNLMQQIYTIKINKTIINLLLITLLGLIIRAFFAFGYEATGDTGTWRLGGRTGVERTQLGMGDGNVYVGDCPTICSNWPPLTFHYMTMMRWVYLNANPLKLPEPGFYKLFPFLADTGTIIVLYFLAKQLKQKHTLLISLIYALHPIAIYVAGYHGQRDTIWVFSSLLTILQLAKENYSGAAPFYALGSSIKIPSLLFAPLLFFMIPKWKNKLAFLFWSALFFILLSSPEIVIYYDRVISQVFMYEGFKNWWGIGFFVSKIAHILKQPEIILQFEPIHKIILYVAIIASNIYFGIKSKAYYLGVLGVLLAIGIFTNPFASQYLIWMLLFITQAENAGLLRPVMNAWPKSV